jgi:hypothetical protein
MSASSNGNASHAKTISGTVRGNLIELNSATGFADGQRVIVTVIPVELTETENGRQFEGLWRSLGGWAEAGPEFDEWLAEVYAARDAEAHRPVGGP